VSAGSREEDWFSVVRRIKRIQESVADGKVDLRAVGMVFNSHFDQDFPALVLELALAEAQRRAG